MESMRGEKWPVGLLVLLFLCNVASASGFFVVFVHGCLGRNTTRFYYAEPLLRPKTLSMRAGCGKKIHKTINVLFACVVAHDSPSNILLMLWEGGWEWA